MPFELLDGAFELDDRVRCGAQSIRAENVLRGMKDGTTVTTWDLRLSRHCVSEDWVFEGTWGGTFSCVSAIVAETLPDLNILTIDAIDAFEFTGVSTFDARFAIRGGNHNFRREIATGNVGQWLLGRHDIVTVEVIDRSLLIATHLVPPTGLPELLSLPRELSRVFPPSQPSEIT